MARRRVELSCPACGGNRLSFPGSDEEQVTCEDCGSTVRTLGAAKALMAGGIGKTDPDGDGASGKAARRRARHTAEIKASQTELRKSIAETDRLVIESDGMLRRHHKECDDDEP